MPEQNDFREVANFHNGAKHLGGKSDRSERTPFQTDLENAYSPLETKRRDTHRQEWRRRWGFMQKEDSWSEFDLKWLESELDEHLPRVTHRGLPILRTDADRQLSPEIKLIIVMDYHMWVAPKAWWKTYFEILRENANL